MTRPADHDAAGYRPINCEFHDVLEALATKRQSTTIAFVDASGGDVQTRSGAIVDVYARDGADWLQLSCGDVVRLDRVLSAGGETQAHYPAEPP